MWFNIIYFEKKKKMVSKCNICFAACAVVAAFVSAASCFCYAAAAFAAAFGAAFACSKCF